MNKVVLKTAFKTLGAVVILLIAAFLVVSFTMPQSMAKFGEDTGNYFIAANYASLRYAYTRDTGDLARCVEDFIYLGDDKGVEKYGGKLIYLDDFDSFCNEKDKQYAEGELNLLTNGYKQYICGKVAVATYNRGNFEAAFDAAKSANKEKDKFPVGNAIAALAVRIAENKDALNGKAMYDLLSEYAPTNADDLVYLGRVKSVLP